jgi:enoyl-CoA hydratase/carnithine racemase
MRQSAKFSIGDPQNSPAVTHGLIVETTSEGLVRVQLNRVHRLNAIDSKLAHILGALWDEVSEMAGVAAVIVTGSGTEAFCIGCTDDSIESSPLSPRAHGVEVPLVVAVNGLVRAAAYDLLAQADHVIAAEHASFLEPPAPWRGVEASGRCTRTPSARSAALSAVEAQAAGMVNDVVPLAELRQRSEEVAHRYGSTRRCTTPHA